MQSKSQLRRLRNSFRHNIRQTTKNLHELGQVVQDGASLKHVRARLRRVPVWLRIVRKVYHKYGLKHVLLILVFVLYQFLGAIVFLFLEEKAEEDKETEWRNAIRENQTKLIDELMRSFFNNTQYLFFLTPEQSDEVYGLLHDQLGNYTANYKHRTDQKIHWDFWNAMLYAGTVCTTIGYGHLFPRTNPGRLATMVYAIFGIPLVFTILDDLGKLLTLGLKWPWLGCKMGIRRAFRHCTGQTAAEIKRMDDEDKKWLPVFDLPIPVAIGVVVAWIFICSAAIRIWETEWDFFLAFYFFFVSLTTIGLGDIVPSHPKYLLMLFGCVIIGLSLVSMCVNLIQAKLERTYEAGREEADLTDAATDVESGSGGTRRRTPPPQTTGTLAAFALNAASRVSLGVLRTNSISSHSLSSAVPKSPTRSRRQTSNKVCQTLLSIASPKFLLDDDDDYDQEQRHIVPTSASLDDVMKLVDTEESDLYVLSHLCGDKAEANLVQSIDNGIHDQDGFMEDDWHALLLPSTDIDNEMGRGGATVQRHPSIGSHVHFRSSISLIPHSNDESTSFAGHLASLAQIDSSSLKSPDSEIARNNNEIVTESVSPYMDKGQCSYQIEHENESERSPLSKRRSEQSTMRSRRDDLRLPVRSMQGRLEQDQGRKTSFVAMLRKRFSQPFHLAALVQRTKRASTGNRAILQNTSGCTSIEEKVHRFSDEELEDNDRTPLEPRRL